MYFYLAALFLFSSVSFGQSVQALFPTSGQTKIKAAKNPVTLQRQFSNLTTSQRLEAQNNQEVTDLQTEITTLKSEKSENLNLINTFKGGIDSYRLNESNAEAARKLETERALKGQAESFQAKINEIESKLQQSQSEFQEYISTQHKSRKLEYVGGDGLRKWNVSKPKGKKI